VAGTWRAWSAGRTAGLRSPSTWRPWPLAGWDIPAVAPDRPTVLFTHGVGTNRQNFLPLARLVHDLGFGVFLFDFRAHGDSDGLVSTPGLREADDLAAAARLLHERAAGRATLWVVEGAGHLECWLHPEYPARLKAFFGAP